MSVDEYGEIAREKEALTSARKNALAGAAAQQAQESNGGLRDWAGLGVQATAKAYAPKPAPFTLGFGQALDALRSGKKATRKGWNGKGLWVALQRPDAQSKMQRPYLYISTVTGELVPWVASHGDLLGEDWAVLE